MCGSFRPYKFGRHAQSGGASHCLTVNGSGLGARCPSPCLMTPGFPLVIPVIGYNRCIWIYFIIYLYLSIYTYTININKPPIVIGVYKLLNQLGEEWGTNCWVFVSLQGLLSRLIHDSIYRSIDSRVYPFVYPCVFSSINLSIHRSIGLFIYLSTIYLTILSHLISSQTYLILCFLFFYFLIYLFFSMYVSFFLSIYHVATVHVVSIWGDI